MGYLRFLLACLVAFSHIMPGYMPLNGGVAAVITFYFISGYLMSGSYLRFQEKSANPALAFYLDRAFRLYPAFLIVFIVSFTWIIFSNSDHIGGNTWVWEMFLLPQTYTQFLDNPSKIIPPTWSLGVEFHYYLFVPLLALLSAGMRKNLFVIFMCGHLIALYFSNHVGEYFPACTKISQSLCDYEISTLLGYEYIIFIGAIFLLGSIAYDGSRKTLGFAVATYAICYFLIFDEQLTHQNVSESLIGVFVFVPLAYLILQKLPKYKPAKLDKLLGSISYPLFLVHYLAKWITEYYFDADLYLPACILLCLAFSLLIAAIQQIIDKTRYKWRGFGKLEPRKLPLAR